MKTIKLSDIDLLTQARAARRGSSGTRSEKQIALARELLNRPHLILGELIAQGTDEVRNHDPFLRRIFPCLTKTEVVRVIDEMARKEWLRLIRGRSSVYILLRDLEAARCQVEKERGARPTCQRSDPPPALPGSGTLDPNFNRGRLFEAIFGGWGSSAYLKRQAERGVTNEKVQSCKPHLKALRYLHGQGRKTWKIELVVEALKTMVLEGHFTIVEGSIDDFDTLVLAPRWRPSTPEPVSPPSPARAPKGAAAATAGVPVVASVSPVVVRRPNEPVLAELTPSARKVILAMREAKIPSTRIFDGPVRFVQRFLRESSGKNVSRDQAVTVLLELRDKKLITVECGRDGKTPLWNRVRVVLPAEIELPVTLAPSALIALLQRIFSLNELKLLADLPPPKVAVIRSILGL